MTRLSISNLAWTDAPIREIGPRIRSAGLDGVELAPTVIWPHAPYVPLDEVQEYARRWHDQGLAVSGVQSLLYGHPEFQIFDPDTWPAMREHLVRVFTLVRSLGAHIAVFGSPKNRIRAGLGAHEANVIAVDFFGSLIPALADCEVVLALEPNAPAYGADYLIDYAETVSLTDLIASPWVQPQVDTGCMAMVGDDPVQALYTRRPAHVHISTPNLQSPPGVVDHSAFSDALHGSRYTGWLVLEMLPVADNSVEGAIEAARWLSDTYAPTWWPSATD